MDLGADMGLPTMMMKTFICNDTKIKGIQRNAELYNYDIGAPVLAEEAMIYELYVYKERVRPLLDNNVCPFFVKAYGAEMNIPFDRMREFLEAKVAIPGIQDDAARRNKVLYNLVRNTISMKFIQLNGGGTGFIYCANLPAEETSDAIVYLNQDIGSMRNRLGDAAQQLSTRIPDEIKRPDYIRYLRRLEAKRFTDLIIPENILTCRDVLSRGGRSPIQRLSIDTNIFEVNGLQIPTGTFRPGQDGKLEIVNDGLKFYGSVNGRLHQLSLLTVSNDRQGLYDPTKRTNNADDPMPLIQFDMDDIKKVEFGYILTESIPDDLATVVRELVNSRNIVELKNILFQCAIACSAMFYSRLAHNDLHLGNARVERKTTPQRILYFIGNTPVELECRYIVKLYDFDRGYIEGFTNVFLNYMEQSSQANAVVEPKDFAKVLCYFNNVTNNTGDARDMVWNTIMNWVAGIVIRDDIPNKRQALSEFYSSDERCFLRDQEKRGRNRRADYNIFNDYATILSNMSAQVNCSMIDNRYYRPSRDRARELIGNQGVSKYFLSPDIFTAGGKIDQTAYLNHQIRMIRSI
jgi:hypothetical protein